MGLATGLNALLGAAQLFVAARLLSESDIGTFALFAIALGAALILFDVGISQAVIYAGVGKQRERAGLTWTLLFFAMAGSALIILGRDSIAGAIRAPDLAGLVVLIPVALLVFLPAQLNRSLLEREMSFGKVAAYEAFGVTIGTALAIILLLDGWGVKSLAIGAVATLIVQALVIGWKSLRTSATVTLLRPSFAVVRSALRFGLPHTAQKIFTFLVSNIDFILIGAMLGAAPLGQYALAYNICNFITSRLNPLVGRVMFPALRRLSDNPERANRAICTVHDMTATFGGAPLLGLGAIAPVAVPWALGTQWQEAGVLVQILAFVGYTRLIGGVSGPAILAFGKPHLGLAWSICASIIQVAAVYAGVRLGGTMGAAIAFALVQVVLLALSWYMLFRPLSGLPFGQYLASIAPGMLTSAIVWAAAAGALRFLGGASPSLAISGSILAGVGAFAIVMLTVRRDFVRRILHMARGAQLA